MKIVFYSVVLLSTFFLSSCTPDTPVTTNNNTAICPQPKLQYKGNGTLYVCNAVPDSRFGWAGYPYFINISDGCVLDFVNYKIGPRQHGSPISYVNFPATQNKIQGSFYFNTPGSTPNIGTYNTVDIALSFNDDTYHYEDVPNSIVLNITSLANGLVSGTFSGVIPAVNNGISHGPQMNITEGVFSNIPVYE